jgi:hypothetical protein
MTQFSDYVPQCCDGAIPRWLSPQFLGKAVEWNNSVWGEQKCRQDNELGRANFNRMATVTDSSFCKIDDQSAGTKDTLRWWIVAYV